MTLYKVELLKNARPRRYDVEIYELEAESDEKAIALPKKLRC